MGAAAITSAPFVSLYYQIGLLIAAVAVAGVMMWTDKFSQRSFSQKTYVALLQLILLCLFVGVGNGVTDLTHYELRTAQALQSDHPKGAYKVGEKSYTTSPRLFAMRCYLMATTHKHGLGNKVFEQWCLLGVELLVCFYLMTRSKGSCFQLVIKNTYWAVRVM